MDKQKQADMKIFEDDIKATAVNLPGHIIKEFTFTKEEQQNLAEQQTIMSLAQNSQNRLINETCLKRVGVQPSPAIHIRYSIGLGRFVVFSPKLPKIKKA